VNGLGASGAFTVTFDDGSLSQLEHGYRVLRALDVRGVLFFVTGLAGSAFRGERLLTVAELRELSAVGWEIGSHTVSHPHLARHGKTQLGPTALRAELRDSKRWLREHGFDAHSFAYPYGRYSDEVERMASSYYRYVRTTADGLNPISERNERLGSYNLCGRKVDRWRRAVDAAATSSQWVIGVVHHVAALPESIPPDDESSWITADQLEECVRYAVDAGLSACTFEDVHAACGAARTEGIR
jgi:peptidoglycan/xylan/chitin deacetylase (PgdA/CDA1 family)